MSRTSDVLSPNVGERPVRVESCIVLCVFGAAFCFWATLLGLIGNSKGTEGSITVMIIFNSIGGMLCVFGICALIQKTCFGRSVHCSASIVPEPHILPLASVSVSEMRLVSISSSTHLSKSLGDCKDSLSA